MGFIDFLKGIKNNVWEPTKRNQSFSAEQR
jgi:hypothetical protein